MKNEAKSLEECLEEAAEASALNAFLNVRDRNANGLPYIVLQIGCNDALSAVLIRRL
jgi:hypothetical protein